MGNKIASEFKDSTGDGRNCQSDKCHKPRIEKYWGSDVRTYSKAIKLNPYVKGRM